MSEALPPPPAASFASDNTAGVPDEVLAALARANSPAALPYDADPWTEQATELLRDLFDAPVVVLPCWGGTGANIAALATLVDPWQLVICPAGAHIVVDEAGGPARFTGASLAPVATEDGKLRPEHVEPYLPWARSEHHPQPGAVSMSQVTESGTRYRVDEIAALCDLAHGHGMRVHVDGARLANAVAAGDDTVASMITETGVDAVSFGATKNGAMYGEALVVLDPELGHRARAVRKQAGQLPSKSRFVSAQLVALLSDGLWLANAAHANAMARLLADRVREIPGVALLREPEANSLFVRLPPERVDRLREWSFFWDWDASRSVYRWMTSFATTAADVERFASGVATILAD